MQCVISAILIITLIGIPIYIATVDPDSFNILSDALEKMDLFNLKHDSKRERIEEALNLIRTETNGILEDLIDPGKRFRELQAV